MFMRGTKWMTKDRRQVIVLSSLRNSAVKVLNEKGMVEVIYESEFAYECTPQVSQPAH